MAPHRGGHLGRWPRLRHDDREVTLDGRVARRVAPRAVGGWPPASPRSQLGDDDAAPRRSSVVGERRMELPDDAAGTRPPLGATTVPRGPTRVEVRLVRQRRRTTAPSNPRRRQISSITPFASSRSNGREGRFQAGARPSPASAIPSRHHSRSLPSARRSPCRSRRSRRRRGRGGGSSRRPRGGCRRALWRSTECWLESGFVTRDQRGRRRCVRSPASGRRRPAVRSARRSRGETRAWRDDLGHAGARERLADAHREARAARADTAASACRGRIPGTTLVAADPGDLLGDVRLDLRCRAARSARSRRGVSAVVRTDVEWLRSPAGDRDRVAGGGRLGRDPDPGQERPLLVGRRGPCRAAG